VQFGEANVQLTFHGNDTKKIAGVDASRWSRTSTTSETSARTLWEVIVNGITGSLTDPKQVYVLRWMAGRHASRARFQLRRTLSRERSRFAQTRSGTAYGFL
jgi:hypothetical protein